MSVATLAHDGIKALEARDHQTAITKLTQALQGSTSPHPNPAWLIARSKAFNAASNFAGALEDADLALHSAIGRGANQRSIIEAHHRRAVAYNRLGELGNADACGFYAMNILEGKKAQPKEDPAAVYVDNDGFWMMDSETLKRDIAAHRLAPDTAPKQRGMNLAAGMKDVGPETRLFTLISQMRTMVINNLVSKEKDDEARKKTVNMTPPKRGIYVPEGVKKEEAKAPKTKATQPETSESKATPAEPAPFPVTENAELNIQSYETDTIMNATIFSKGVDKENLKVHFTESTVALNPMKYPGGVEKECVISLNGSIKPSECSYRVTPSKVELKLVKTEAGKWKSVGQQGVAPPDGKEEAAFTSASVAPLESLGTPSEVPEPSARGPAYPTSSRSGPVNWDKVVQEEDADDNDEEKEGVNDFFQKIYSGADPDMKRAMMKSFTESNGTSLSTNWDEVGKGKVETVPPEGVEAKKW